VAIENASLYQQVRGHSQLLEQRVAERTRDLENALARLQMVQVQMVQSGKMAAIGQMASAIAHEVNNPLTAVIGMISLMKSDPAFPTSFQEDAALVEHEASRIKIILVDLLKFSRSFNLVAQATDVRSIFAPALAVVKPEAQMHRVEILEDFPESLPNLHVIGGQLQQVLLNLLLNAIQAMPNGGRVTVSAEATERDVRITVRDTGPGIPPEILPKIFEPFFTTKPSGQGTGLGLCICAKIVADHHGTLTASSGGPGQGAAFVLTLPRGSGG
jgi:signal transduction histidine kinase